MFTYTLKVVELRTETHDTVTVCFKQPGLKKIKYLAGQYLTLIFRINGRRYIRPYSFSSAPVLDQNIEVTIKRVPGGVVSNHIIDQVKVGDVIEVMQPLGDFTLENVEDIAGKHLVLWGAGSGITPLISIAKFALHNKVCEHITLVYGNKHSESIIFRDKIEFLRSTFENFSVFNFHSQISISERNPNVIEGRINPNKVLSVMENEGKLLNTIHYICGPVGLKQSVKDQLYYLGIPESNIHSEDFEIVKDPKDFDNVKTQIVEIEVENNNHNVEVVKGKSMLEAGLDAGLELPYSCQTGSCLICKGKLISGELKMLDTSKRDELMPDEYLLCCSYPLNDNVKVLVTN